LLLPHEVGQRPCYHQRFVVDGTKAEVECGDCHEKLNPMWVLTQLAMRDHRFHEAHERYAEEMRRLDERHRTKCDHCGRMTRIRRRR
jgi:Zn finger protein HypA/HybF involved in hydrogenase expression